MTTIKTNGREILVVEVPEDAHEQYYDIWNGILCENKRLTQHDGLHNCKIIGLLRDLLESECEGLVAMKLTDLISLLQSNGLNTSNNLLLIEKI